MTILSAAAREYVERAGIDRPACRVCGDTADLIRDMTPSWELLDSLICRDVGDCFERKYGD